MENYVYLDGQKQLLTEDQEIRVRRALAPPTLGEIAEGQVVSLGGVEFIVLRHLVDATEMITRDVIWQTIFDGETNNYAQSGLREIMDRLADQLAGAVGAENLLRHTVSLTADDGLKDYGQVVDRASPLTAGQYRTYVEILDRYPVEQWWWLATPYTTPTHDTDNLVRCVSPLGALFQEHHEAKDGGVRPFLCLSSKTPIRSV